MNDIEIELKYNKKENIIIYTKLNGLESQLKDHIYEL